MTHQPLHPSQLSSYIEMHYRATLASWGLLMIAWVLIVSAGFSKHPWLKASLLGSGFAVTLAAKPVRKIAIASERISNDVEDISQTAFQNWLWDALKPTATLEQTIDIGDAQIVQEIPTYDLADVGRAHHTIISGPTGAGKSELVKWLVSRYFQTSKVKVYDCDSSPRDWQGLEVIGREGDFLGISGAMVEDLDLLDHRCKRLGKGEEVGGEEVRICEELPTVAAELSEMIDGRKTSVAANWLKRIARRGRKYRIKLILVTQETSVAAMGIEGEGAVRKAFTIFYLGAAALEQAEKLRTKDKALCVAFQEYLKRCDRPCLVDHKGNFYAVNIPELGVNHNFPPTSHQLPITSHAEVKEVQLPSTSDLRKSLEGLYQGSSDLQEFQAEVTSEASDFALYQAIKALLEVDSSGKPKKSKTWIVENILGFRGRSFDEGMKRLEQLLKRWE